MDKSIPMNWKPYKQGQLAKCNHGYYFVYQKFHHEVGSNRWFIKYEPGTHAFGEKATLTGNPRGFKTLEEAHAHSEKNAEDTERALE